MKRKEKAQVLIPGLTSSGDMEVDVLVCNRCGTKVLPARATERAWVQVLSDGRGGKNLDFCDPRHAAEYFRELIAPATAEDAVEFILVAENNESGTSRIGSVAAD